MPSQQDSLTDFILLAACGANELLPQSPHVPADVFTACLTTPIKVQHAQQRLTGISRPFNADHTA